MSKKSKHKGNHQPVHYGKKQEPKNMETVKDSPEQNSTQPIDFSQAVTLVFQATDTLFFRESRPMESMGELQSVFPPPVRTLAGAVRSLIGTQQQIDWREFHEAKGNHPAVELIGYGDDLGKLSFQGAWLSHDSKRLYPAPLLLMKKENDLLRLQLAEKGIWCDLGKNVRLPILPKEAAGSKPLEDTWLTQTDLETVLRGSTPKYENFLKASQLFERESRVGIARNNSTRTVEPSLLYQTRHIRPCKDVTIELDASGLPEDISRNNMIRLGGEGRSASLEIKAKQAAFPQAPTADNKTQGLLLFLLTPLQITQTKGAWQPLPGFTCEEREGLTVWTGTLHNIELELHGAVTGKALREGGWDMAKHQPRTVTSLIPAGSVFFCKAKNGNTSAAIEALHNTQIGELTAYGYGHLAAGLWLKD